MSREPFKALNVCRSVPFDRMEFQCPGGHLWSLQGTCKCVLCAELRVAAYTLAAFWRACFLKRLASGTEFSCLLASWLLCF